MNKDIQINWLADRLALALAFIEDVELDVEFEREADEPNRFSEARHGILSNTDTFEKLREKQRGSNFYEEAKNAIREGLKGELRKSVRGREAA